MKHHFRDLEIWKDGLELSKITYELTRKFPKAEIFGLTSQMRRCAISIPSNIAEGTGRNSVKDFTYFLAIAKGSSFELNTQLILARDLGFITEEQLLPVLEKLLVLQKKIFRFVEKINT